MDRKRWQIYFPDSKNKEDEKKIGDKMAYMAVGRESRKTLKAKEYASRRAKTES